MKRTGRVISSRDGMLQVCFERPEMCEKCGACGKHPETLVQLAGDAEIGDFVDVEMPEAQLLKVSLLVYLTPLAGLLIGLFAGMALFENELFWALSAIVVMLLSLLLVKTYDKKVKAKPALQPHIVAVRKKEDNENE